MSALIPFIQYVSEPVVAITRQLADALAAADHRKADDGVSYAAAFSITAGLLGAACIYWACWMHARLGNFRIAMQMEKSRSDMSVLFRNALLLQANQSVLVMRNGEKEPEYFGEARELLQACRAGQDGPALALALEELVEMGKPFTLAARTEPGQSLTVRGLAIADRAVLYFQEERKIAQNFRKLLDALPMPVWLYDADARLAWANSAFLQAAGVERIEDIAAGKLGQDWLLSDQAGTILENGTAMETQRDAIIAGERRTFALSLLPLPGAAAGIALDITAAVRSQTRRNLELAAQTDMLEKLGTAIAVFDAERRLVSHNTAYASLWDLPEAWLDEHPTQDEIFDRLRDSRKLPEQRNFAEWKQEQAQLFENLGAPQQALWHLPGDTSLRVITQPHLGGGIFVIFENISEQLRLEATVTLLTQVQRATLDTIDDGMAIFGMDGRLLQYNGPFAKMWQLTEAELASQPHFAEIAGLCTARIGRDGIWGIVSRGVNSAHPENLNEWSKTRRADGKLISLALSRLPNGATVVTFSDLTDLERFTNEQNSSEIVTENATQASA
jgi:PAS domain-containing protein